MTADLQDIFDRFVLDTEQIDLLKVLVEASRNVSRENREKFMVARSTSGAIVMHEGLGKHGVRIYMGDVEELAKTELVNLDYGPRGTPRFDVAPLGFRYYEYLYSKSAEPVRAVEEMPHEYLDASGFQERHPAAYSKWSEAQKLLWSAESAKQLTAIGHHCREAVQEFATSLVQIHKPAGVDENPRNTVARLRAVINHHRKSLGDRVAAFLDASIQYWGALNDLIQRQEHGGQKEGEPLIWNDARRVVFQTAVVMFELDATLSKRS
jgi:hypothetical protein